MLGLIEQSIGRVAQPVGGIGRARRENLVLQRVQAMAAHGPAQALPTNAVALAAQGDLQPKVRWSSE